IRAKGEAAVACVGGELHVERPGRPAIREHGKVVLLLLGLVDSGRVEGGDAVDDEGRLGARAVRNLEVADERARDQLELRLVVEPVLEKAEAVTLARVVVDGPARPGRRNPRRLRPGNPRPGR